MHDKQKIDIVCIGDVSTKAGRLMCDRTIPELQKEYAPDVIIVNGENAADDGRGILPAHAHALFARGAQVITTGNHAWAKKEIIPYFSEEKRILRPANFPSAAPGSGVCMVQTADGYTVACINLQGRVYMKEHLACPFEMADMLVARCREVTPVIIVDFHAEATSEKICMAHHLDGRITALVGTHTHVQTADERILPKGTAYITDLGMVGAYHSALGLAFDPIIKGFQTQMPSKFMPELSEPWILSGVAIRCDAHTGRAESITRIRRITPTENS